MSVLALASAKGAPGVTTAAVALGAVWPRRVLLVEGDPAGGDLAARFHLPPEPNLVSLGMVARRGQLTPEEVRGTPSGCRAGWRC
jgi:MinD-like ATPase involved in chromosome partitioning or flagellar assembly